MVTSKLSPFSGSAVLRQLNPIHKNGQKSFKSVFPPQTHIAPDSNILIINFMICTFEIVENQTFKILKKLTSKTHFWKQNLYNLFSYTLRSIYHCLKMSIFDV